MACVDFQFSWEASLGATNQESRDLLLCRRQLHGHQGASPGSPGWGSRRSFSLWIVTALQPNCRKPSCVTQPLAWPVNWAQKLCLAPSLAVWGSGALPQLREFSLIFFELKLPCVPCSSPKLQQSPLWKGWINKPIPVWICYGGSTLAINCCPQT